jgi:hypothetical protein
VEAESAIEGGVEALGEVVNALGRAMEEHGDAGFSVTDGQAGEALTGLKELEAGGAVKAMLIGGEVLGDLMLSFGDELGGG